MAASASMTPEQANAMVGEFFQAKKEAAGAAAKAESEAFLEKCKNKDVNVTASVCSTPTSPSEKAKIQPRRQP